MVGGTTAAKKEMLGFHPEWIEEISEYIDREQIELKHSFKYSLPDIGRIVIAGNQLSESGDVHGYSS